MIKNLRKDIFIYIYIFFDNCVHTRKLHSNGSEKEFLLFTFPCPIFSCFYPLIVKLTKRAGELSRRNGRGGEDYANRPIIICAQLVGARTICLLNGRSSAKSNGN